VTRRCRGLLRRASFPLLRLQFKLDNLRVLLLLDLFVIHLSDYAVLKLPAKLPCDFAQPLFELLSHLIDIRSVVPPFDGVVEIYDWWQCLLLVSRQQNFTVVAQLNCSF